MHHQHTLIFPLISLGLAIFGSWTALDLFRRVRRHDGLVQARWVAAAAVAMGVSIWSMHFVAMLGFDPGGPVSYDVGLTLTSLLLAVFGTGVAFSLCAGRSEAVWRVPAGGAVMGLSIGAMHYVGMAALQTSAAIGYQPVWVAASITVALGASIAALIAARRDSVASWRLAASVVLGAGIAAMHYTAMTGLVLSPTAVVATGVGVSPIWLAFGIAGLTILLLVLALGASLLDQKQTLLSALDAGRMGYWEMDIPRRRLTLSDQGRSLLGFPLEAPFDQSRVADLLTTDSAARRALLLEDAIARGLDYHADYEMRDGRWLEVRGRMVLDGAGRPHRLVGVIQDVTGHRLAFRALMRSEERQRILINELNHRVKNSLATILSIAKLTSRRAADLPSFVAGFEARLMAMSATHNLLTAEGWEQAELRSILQSELRPYAAEQIRLSGPEVKLGSEQVLAMGLVIHELVTNAVKYGALGVASGALDVSWTLLSGVLTLEWREQGGPAVETPTRLGFGSRLIEMSARTLGGRSELRYPPAGFEATISLSIRPGDGAGAALI